MQSIALKIETGDGIRSQLETRKNGEGFFFFLLPERDIIARLVTRFNCGRSGVPFPPPLPSSPFLPPRPVGEITDANRFPDMEDVKVVWEVNGKAGRRSGREGGVGTA